MWRRRSRNRKIFEDGKYIFCGGEEKRKKEKEENIWRRNKYFLLRRRKTEKEKEQNIWRRILFCNIFFVGAAVSGMRIEINTGNSYFMTAAGRRRGRFFIVDLGPWQLLVACG